MSKTLPLCLINLGTNIHRVPPAEGRLGHLHGLLLIVPDGAELAGLWPIHTGTELWY